MSSRPLQRADLMALAGSMKDIQRRALLSLTSDEHPGPSMARLWDNKPIGGAFERAGFLIAVAGAVEVHPGVASTFLYATDDMGKVILELSRYFKLLFAHLKGMGFHRVHSLGLANDPEGRRWKEDVLGAWPEAHLEKFGKGGEDFVLHAILL